MKNKEPLFKKWFDEASIITEEMFDKLEERKISSVDYGSGHSVAMKVVGVKHNGIFYIKTEKMQNQLSIKNTVSLKDGRKVHSCGFGFNYWVETAKGVITPVSEKYYNKCSHLPRI